jgi:hypothetical protein
MQALQKEINRKTCGPDIPTPTMPEVLSASTSPKNLPQVVEPEAVGKSRIDIYQSYS